MKHSPQHGGKNLQPNVLVKLQSYHEAPFMLVAILKHKRVTLIETKPTQKNQKANCSNPR